MADTLPPLPKPARASGAQMCHPGYDKAFFDCYSSDQMESYARAAIAAHAEKATGHKPSHYDVWLMARGLMTADGRCAQPVQQPGAEPNIIYSPIATKPQADGRHPNDNEPADPDRSHWLTMRGDDEGQGLDPYWKWGHAAGWNDHKKAAPAQRQPLTVPALTDAQMSECAWGYVADSRNLDAGVTGIIQATQLACAAAWGATLAAQKGEKL